MIIKKPSIKNKLPSLRLLKKIAISSLFFLTLLTLVNFDYFKINFLKANLSFYPEKNFFDQAIEITIHSPIKKAKIYYTLDGSEPTINSSIYLDKQKIDIKENTVIRAVLYKNNQQFAEIVNKSYFIGFTSELPIISIITDPKNLWDQNTGIYVVGSNPNEPNYLKRDDSWQRAAYFSFFENNKEIFSRSVNIRTSGGASSHFPQKSFNIYFDDSLNNNSNNSVNYQIFKDNTRKIFDSIKLRNSGNDWASTLIRDCLMQELLRDHTTLDIQSCRPAVVLLNNDYWGIYNIRDRYNKQYFIEKNSDFKLDSNKIIVSTTNNDPGKKGYPKIQIGKEKDGDAYLDLIKYLANNDLSRNDIFQKVAEKIDIDNFIDYNIAQFFYANYDWPYTNNKFWRYKNEIMDEDLSPIDGRWRWLIFDTDYGFSVEDGEAFCSHCRSAKPNAESLDMFYVIAKEEYVFKNLFKNAKFRENFVLRYFDLLNTAFQQQRVINKINELAKKIDDEIPRHTARWGQETGGMLENYQDWQNNLENLKIFAKERPQYVVQHIIDYFQLAGIYQLELKTTGNCQGQISINSLNPINEMLPWIAKYPINYPLNLEVESTNDCQFLFWSSEIFPKGLSDEKKITINPPDDFTLTANFKKNN